MSCTVACPTRTRATVRVMSPRWRMAREAVSIQQNASPTRTREWLIRLLPTMLVRTVTRGRYKGRGMCDANDVVGLAWLYR